MYSDYTFYQDIYGGKATEQIYLRFALIANNKINCITFGRATEIETDTEEYTMLQYTECEIVDLLNGQQARANGVSSESTGSYSISWDTGKSVDDLIYSTIKYSLPCELTKARSGFLCS